MCLPMNTQAVTETQWVKNRRRMSRWLLSLPKPVAIFCIYDLRGLEVARACRQLGLRVPEDVALVGMTDDEITCHDVRSPSVQR